MNQSSKGSLFPQRRRLLELFQQINFGRLENLKIKNREPIFDPPPRVVYEVKFCGENGPRPEIEAADFLLKAQIVELFQNFDNLGDGIIDSIEIKNGLPFRMFRKENAA